MTLLGAHGSSGLPQKPRLKRTVWVADHAWQRAEVVALGLLHPAHPGVVIQIEAQGPVIPDGPFCLLSLIQHL